MLSDSRASHFRPPPPPLRFLYVTCCLLLSPSRASFLLYALIPTSHVHDVYQVTLSTISMLRREPWARYRLLRDEKANTQKYNTNSNRLPTVKYLVIPNLIQFSPIAPSPPYPPSPFPLSRTKYMVHEYANYANTRCTRIQLKIKRQETNTQDSTEGQTR